MQLSQSCYFCNFNYMLLLFLYYLVLWDCCYFKVLTFIFLFLHFFVKLLKIIIYFNFIKRVLTNSKYFQYTYVHMYVCKYIVFFLNQINNRKIRNMEIFP